MTEKDDSQVRVAFKERKGPKLNEVVQSNTCSGMLAVESFKHLKYSIYLFILKQAYQRG